MEIQIDPEDSLSKAIADEVIAVMNRVPPKFKVVGWRWLYEKLDGTLAPDSNTMFPLPGPDEDIQAIAAASIYKRVPQYLYVIEEN